MRHKCYIDVLNWRNILKLQYDIQNVFSIYFKLVQNYDA